MKTIKKILDLLTTSEKKRALILLGLILIMALLDMLGVASILPFIALLANPSLLETNVFLSYLYGIATTLGVTNTSQFLFVLGMLVFVLLMLSLSVRALATYAQVRFSLMREYSIGKRLVEGYLHQPYIWFLNRNSADLGKSILSEVNQVITYTIVPVINVIAQGAVTIALLALLLIADPILALTVGLVLSICYVSIFFLVKNILSSIGSQRLEANTERFTILSEAFGAIKQIKVGGLENLYIKKFSKPAEMYASNQSLAQVISLLPRFFIEGIAFGGMIILVLALMANGEGFSDIIPLISLYAFAGYRLLPAIQIIYFSIAQLRFSGPALHALHKDLINLQTFEQASNLMSAIPLTKSIEFKNIHFSYPNSKHPALTDISLVIPAFTTVGIVGTTGSGKTTKVDIILGLLDANEGEFNVDGKPIVANNKRRWQKSIGYVPQQIYISDSTIASNIAFGVNEKNIDQKSLEQAAKIANLHNFVVDELPQSYNTNIGERGIRLSGGQLQRIGIARALYHKPQLLILDEATSALDNLTEKAVMEAIKNLEKKVTIIMIAHRLSTVKNCDNIFFLEKGQLKAQGTYKELNQSSEVFKKMSKLI